MNDEIRVCIDRVLPAELQVEAAERALTESPANVPILSFRPGLGVAGPTRFELALLTGKKWENGRDLRVSFMDGQPEVQDKVGHFARLWSDQANVTFDFGADPAAEIRISFRQRGSWSYLGTDALAIPAGQPTMNFGWLTPISSDAEVERVVVHEFGHALGCIHEHQNPAADIPWDREAVYGYYGGPPNNWTRAQVDLNLFQKYSQTITQFSDFDSRSIMLYPIPNAHTVGDFEVGWNIGLSPTDEAFIGAMYPKPEKAVVELEVGGPAAEASIGQHGEEDLFRFRAEEEATYVLETEGRTDVVMALLGPDSPTDLLAQDDDSGQGLNARIVVGLIPASYHVRVRHFRPRGTGAYRISVRQASPP